MIATTVLFFHFLGATGTVKHLAILIQVYLLSYLMVSTFTYFSFKHPETNKAKTFHVLVAMVLVLIVVATEPSVTLFMLGTAYTLSGPVYSLYKLVVKKKAIAEDKQKSLYSKR